MKRIRRLRRPFLIVGVLDIVLIIITFRYGNLLTDQNFSFFYVLMMAILILHNMVLYYANCSFIACNFVELAAYIFFLMYGIILEIAIIVKDLYVKSTSEVVTYGLSFSIIIKLGMIWKLKQIFTSHYAMSAYFIYRKTGPNIQRIRSMVLRGLIQVFYHFDIFFYTIRMCHWFLPAESFIIFILRIIVLLLLIFSVFASKVLIHVEYIPLRRLIIRVVRFAFLFDIIALILMNSPLIDLKGSRPTIILTTTPQLAINFVLSILLASEIKYFCGDRFAYYSNNYLLGFCGEGSIAVE